MKGTPSARAGSTMTVSIPSSRRRPQMLRHSAKIMLATAGVVGVLGAGVAVASDPVTCPYGNTPKVTQTQAATGTATQQRLRERDGTGARHAQRSQQRGQGQAGRHHGRHAGAGNGAGNAIGNPNCPYRS
jgi:hypothetical protein